MPKPPDFFIRQAEPADIKHLASIELAAARLLEGHAPSEVLAETTIDADFHIAQRGGLLWIAVADGLPVGFAQTKVLEPDYLHLEELDVHPAHGRRGLGTRLVRAVCDGAAARGFRAVTLSRFRDVAWNRPFYERLGFEEVFRDNLSSALRYVVANEARRGLDITKRLVMRRSTDTPSTPIDPR